MLSTAVGAGPAAGAARAPEPTPRPQAVTALQKALASEQAQQHYHGRVTGCVQPAEDGLRLLDEKNNKTYTLVPGDVLVKPGQRVLLKGKKSNSDGGTQTFTAKKLVKDLGSCSAPASANSANSGSPASR